MAIEKIIETTSSFPYKSTIIVLITIKYVFENYLNFRQYRKVSSDSPMPKELDYAGIEQFTFISSKKYSKAKLEFSFVSDLVSQIIETLLIVFNYSAFIWGKSIKILQALGLDDTNEYYALFCFMLIDILRTNIIDIPFSYYSSFVLEAKFGFNKKTQRLFVIDLIKSVILQIIFFPILIALVILAINYGGKYFYFFAEIVCIIITIVAMWIYPNFIMPLFNRMTELEEGPVKKKLYNLAEKLNFPLKKIFVIDSSIRTLHSNAALFGFGNNKRIILFDTLIEKLSPEEIEAVLGHELGHWWYSHSLKKMTFALSETFGMLYLFSFFMNNTDMFVSFGFDTTSTFIGISLFFQIFVPVSYIFNIISNKLTRTMEFQADAFTIEHNLDKFLQEGLKKLIEKNLGDMDPDPIYSSFNNTHPSFIERIKALDDFKSKKH